MLGITKPQKTSKPNIKNDVYFVYQDEVSKEVVEKYSKDLLYLCGRKGFSLVQISPYDIPVPKFLVITSNVFDLLYSGKISQFSPQDHMPVIDIPHELTMDILKYYARMSGFSDAWLAIRPSICLPNSMASLNFSGQMDTLLNVRGEEDLIKAIKQVYASFWLPDVQKFFASNKVKLADVKLSIVLQKMVQSESSGVVFTTNPINKDENEVMVEAVFGLGDVIANGLITPDQYIVSAKNLEIKEKIIAPQEWMMIRDVPKKGKVSNDRKVDISAAWQRKRKLEDTYIRELAEIALMLKEALTRDIEIEWAYSGGQLWILQIKDSLDINIVDNETEENLKISDNVMKDLVKKIKQQKAKPPQGTKNSQIPEGATAIISGAQTNGIEKVVKGKVLIVNSALLDRIDLISEQILDKDFILVTDKLSHKLVKVIDKVQAIISNEGPFGSDLAIDATANNIPILTNTFIATWVLKNGEYIIVDGKRGEVFEHKDNLSHKLSNETIVKKEKKIESNAQKKAIIIAPKIETKDTVTQLYVDISKELDFPLYVDSKGINGMFSLNLRDLIRHINISPYSLNTPESLKEYYESITDNIQNFADNDQGKIVALTLDLPKNVAFYKKLKHHPENVTQISPETDILPLALKAVRKLNTVHKKRNVWLTVDNTRTSREFLDIYRTISAAGFRRSLYFKLGINVCFPAILHDLDPIMENLDYIVIDVDTLIVHLFASTEMITAENISSSIILGIVKDIVEKANPIRIPVFVHTRIGNYVEIQKIIKQYIHEVKISGFVLSDRLLAKRFVQINKLISNVENDFILSR